MLSVRRLLARSVALGALTAVLAQSAGIASAQSLTLPPGPGLSISPLPSQLIQNGDFELGTTSWDTYGDVRALSGKQHCGRQYLDLVPSAHVNWFSFSGSLYNENVVKLRLKPSSS